jgi:hypothetical protein
MPQLGLKSIHIYNLKKFQKIQKIIAFTAACPKSLNSIYGTHMPLGVKNSALLWACSQPLSMQQNLLKTAKICLNLPKGKTLKYHQKLRF